MDNVIKYINKEEFNDNYTKCVPNGSGQLKCEDIKDINENISTVCNNNVNDYGNDKYVDKDTINVKTCIHGFFNDDTGIPSNFKFDTGGKITTGKILSECTDYKTALNSISKYCYGLGPNSPSNNQLPEIQIANELQSPNTTLAENGNGTICDNDTLKENIKIYNLTQFKFNNKYKFTDREDNEIGCNKMIRLKETCKANSIPNVQERLKRYYDSFVNGVGLSFEGSVSSNEVLNASNFAGIDKDLVELSNFVDQGKKNEKIQQISRAVKLGMCNLAHDNISDVLDETDVYEWWDKNILGNGFQLNIYIISLFICLYFKYKILDGLGSYINIICIILSLVLFLILINFQENVIIKYYLLILGYILPIIITFSVLIRLYFMNKYLSFSPSNSGLIIIIIVMFFIYSIFYIPNYKSNAFYIALLFFFLIFILLYTTLSKTNILPNYSIILFILLFMIGLFFYKLSKVNDPIWNIGGFYVIFIIIIILIFSLNTELHKSKSNLYSSYLKAKSLPLNNKNLTDVILLIYKIIAVGGDTIFTIFSPQFSLLLMILFRLVHGYWYEPLNAVYSSITGFYMNKPGEKPTTNSYIL